MTDNHPQSEENDQTQSITASDEQIESDLQHKIVQQVQHLMYQDKSTVIVEVVNLNVKQVQLEKDIGLLQQAIKKLMEEKEILQQSLLGEQKIQLAVQTIERQRKSVSIKLTEEYKLVDEQIKSVDNIRSQLKHDVGTNRASIEHLNKRIQAIGEKATKQAKEFAITQERWNASRAELKEQVDKLLEQNSALLRAHEEAVTKYEAYAKERDIELTKVSDELTRTRNEQQQERETMAKQNEALSKLQSEKDQLAQQFEQLKLKSESELNHLQQELQKNVADMNQRQEEGDSEISKLKEKVRDLEQEKRILEEHNEGLQNAISKKSDELRKCYYHIEELEAKGRNKKITEISTASAMGSLAASPMKPVTFPFPKSRIFGKRPPALKSTGPMFKPSTGTGTKVVSSLNLRLMESFHHDNEMDIIDSSLSNATKVTEK